VMHIHTKVGIFQYCPCFFLVKCFLTCPCACKTIKELGNTRNTKTFEKNYKINNSFSTPELFQSLWGLFNAGIISAFTTANHNNRLPQLRKKVKKKATRQPSPCSGQVSVHQATTMGPKMPAIAPMVLPVGRR